MTPTDDDVRAALRRTAITATTVLDKGMTGKLLGECYNDSKDAYNRMLAAKATIESWAKSLPQSPPVMFTAPDNPEQRRADAIRALRSPSPELRGVLDEAGLELREKPKSVVESP